MAAIDIKPVALRGHDDFINDLAFSSDGRWLATASRDGTARMWRVNLGELVQMTCTHAGRNLAWDEWQTYFPGEAYRPTCPQWGVHPSVPETDLP